MITTKINPEITKKYLLPPEQGKRGSYKKQAIGECPCGCKMPVVGTRNRIYFSDSCKSRARIQRMAEKIARGLK